jgi:H+/Na+-translocating ferredoxin:NAD+ oxidoreductase subunit E
MTVQTTPSLGITWQHPNFLLPLFCLCTLLGSTQSLATALGMAIVVTLLTVLCNLLVFSLSRWLQGSTSTPLWLMCAATLVVLAEMLLNAWFYELYRQLGLFLPMSVISCLLLARREMQLQQPTLYDCVRRSMLMSAGYALAALVLGAGRELVGHGSLFADAGALLGQWATPLEMQMFRADMGFMMAVLAPGAFIGLGLGVALYNWLWLQFKK